MILVKLGRPKELMQYHRKGIPTQTGVMSSKVLASDITNTEVFFSYLYRMLPTGLHMNMKSKFAAALLCTPVCGIA
jgi:hypothetical protein